MGELTGLVPADQLLLISFDADPFHGSIRSRGSDSCRDLILLVDLHAARLNETGAAHRRGPLRVGLGGGGGGGSRRGFSIAFDRVAARCGESRSGTWSATR